ncbi:MAG: ABC transporter permease [Acidobacteriota bacterium]
MDNLIQDLRYAFRALLKKPFFAVIAIMTLSLGIGANTAIFSVVNGVLLRPLPFPEPERLMMVYNTSGKEDQGSATYPDFNDWRERNQSFTQLAAYSTRDFTITGVGEPFRLRGAMVTHELLPLLGVSPEQGRFFSAEEDKPGARAVILSHRVWQEYFGSEGRLPEKPINLNGQNYNVIGVMPAGFVFPIQTEPVIELWTTTATMQEGRAPLTAQRGNHALEVIGRLKAGVTPEQAQAEMSLIVSDIAQQFPDTNSEFGVRVAALHQDLIRDFSLALWLLFGAVACVLLIACANVANLLLARATTRQKEVAIRTALGASRWRIIRQLITESLLLSVSGGMLGMLIAMWGTDLVLSLVPKGLPRAASIGFDASVLIFTTLISVVTGLLFGIAPALQISKTSLTQSLKEGGRSASGGAQHNRIRSVFVVAEVAIALTLLVTAGLLINSFFRLQNLKPGFETTNLLSFRLGLPDTRYPQEQHLTNFYNQLASRIEGIAGVKDVAYITALPFSGQGAGVGFSIEGEPGEPNRPFPYETDLRTVSSGYFHAMGIQLLSGRDFDERDTSTSNQVVIINETLANKFFPNQNPIGKRINPSFATDDRGILMREIIGVVSDIKHRTLNEEPRAEVYIAYPQNPRPTMFYVVRTTNDPTATVAAIRSEVQSLDKDLPMYNIKTLDQYISASVSQPRFNMLLLCIFASAALLLTIVGLYGVMSYAVTQRTHEIGVRMALGAQTGDVIRLIVKHGLKLTFIGIAIGLAGALALGRITESLLFGVTASDPVTFIVVSLILTGVALVACLVPARRATKVDPMIALRYE